MRVLSFDELVKSGEFSKTPTALSIGVFDGVHKGHQAILERLIEVKRERNADMTAVITFSENPKGRNGALDTLRLRAQYIASFGVDVLAVIDFSPVFSKITACGFTELLAAAFKPVAAVVGEDFRFGNPQSDGDGEKLQSLLAARGVDSVSYTVDSVKDEDGVKISSTRLRLMIEKGDLGCFLGLSGQFYRVDLVPLPYRSGSEELIFSRASIHQLLPPPGVYDAALLLSDGRKVKCTAVISDESLSIHDVLSGKACGKDELLLDSLYLEKRR